MLAPTILTEIVNIFDKSNLFYEHHAKYRMQNTE